MEMDLPMIANKCVLIRGRIFILIRLIPGKSLKIFLVEVKIGLK
jgi:hypothetical protein